MNSAHVRRMANGPDSANSVSSALILGSVNFALLVTLGSLVQLFPGNLVLLVGVPAVSAALLAVQVWWVHTRIGLSLRDFLTSFGEMGVRKAILSGIAAGAGWSIISSQVFKSATIGEFLAAYQVLLIPVSAVGLSDVFLAPIWEETYFRGIAFSALMKRWGVIPAIFLQALISSVVHLDFPGIVDFDVFSFRFCTSCVLGITFYLTGSLYSSIAAHSCVNWFLAAS